MHKTTSVDVMDAIVKYAYNVDFHEFSADLFSATSDRVYRYEKYSRMNENLSAFWGGLDSGNRERFVAAALRRAEGV